MRAGGLAARIHSHPVRVDELPWQPSGRPGIEGEPLAVQASGGCTLYVEYAGLPGLRGAPDPSTGE